MAITVLHLAPHPDDEAIGAGATLLALRAAGHRVINLACGLGSRPEDRPRRQAEVEEACRRARFELRVHDAARPLAPAIAELVAAERAALLIAPSPGDAHPAHEAVGRAALDALAPLRDPPRLWQWSLWADLARPTLYHGFGDQRLEEVQHVLAAHAGELARNDFATLLRARAEANRVLGAERVFGWGSPGRPERYAELLTELVADGRGGLRRTPPRVLDPADPLP